MLSRGMFNDPSYLFRLHKGLKSKKLLLFSTPQWFLLFDFGVNPSLFTQSFLETSTSEAALYYINIFVKYSSSDLNHLSRKT